MWTTLGTYIFLGFSVAAVPGAVFFEVIRRTLSDKVSLLKFLLGNLAGMVILALSVLLGFARLINNPLVANIFYISCGVVLVVLGITSILNTSSNKPKSHKSRYGAFATGLSLSVLNPLGIVFWIALVGKIVQEANDMTQVILNITGVTVGSLILFGIVIVLISTFKLKITPKYLTILSRSFGFVIFVYGLLSFSKVTL